MSLKENLYDLADAVYTFPRNFYYVLKISLEGFTDLKHRYEIIDNSIKAARYAYSGDIQSMENHLKSVGVAL